MDSDGKFWWAMWALLGVVLLGILGIAAMYYHSRDVIAQDLVQRGEDPIAVGCMLTRTMDTAAECVALGANETNCPGLGEGGDP